MAAVKRGLGKSFGKIFGEDKITDDTLNENRNIDNNEYHNIKVPDSQLFVRPEAPENDNSSQELVGDDIESVFNQIDKKTDGNAENNNENQENNNDNDNQFEKNSENTSNNENLEGKPLFVRTNLVQPYLNQPRKHFDEEKLKELAESIKIHGILEPLIVRKNGALYELIAGERRWRAAKLAELNEVPIIIKDFSDKELREASLVENILREDLNVVEKALAYNDLMKEYSFTQEDVAKRVGISRAAVANTLRILTLGDEVIEMLKEGKLTEGHARAILSIEDEEERKKIAKRAVDENLTVRKIEDLARLEKYEKIGKNAEKYEESQAFSELKIQIKDIEKRMKNKLSAKLRILPKDENSGHIDIKYNTKEELDNIFLLINSIGMEN